MGDVILTSRMKNSKFHFRNFKSENSDIWRNVLATCFQLIALAVPGNAPVLVNATTSPEFLTNLSMPV
jgi:hypothetical protein